MSELILQELNEGVLLITLNNPKKKNAFNAEAWIGLAETLNSAKDNPEINVVVITGAGKDFSAGQDLGDLTGKDDAGLSPYQHTERALLDFDKPVLMCAKGVAVGGGGTILFHADIAYVGESLRFRLPFTSLGLAPEFGSSYLLQANIGAQRAAEILLCAEWLDADQAVECGIAARKFSDDELLDKTLEKAHTIAKLAPNALRESKRCIKLAQRQHLEAAYKMESDSMDKLRGSEENTEAIMALFEKREPDFKKLAK
ncbi:enoyl-CoA hydratase [Maricurvus nonylphenolicus]|uniref:enoyl-CoA hydratase/isomerase family protein n=1 Tax=Maricurvus nonylphenolicus TaxID=1008307 RepID=UPI0036F21316